MDISERIQSHYRIHNAQYEQLAKIFNPLCFDAEEGVLDHIKSFRMHS